MTQKLLIIGAGAQARYILNTISLLEGIQVIGLLDTFNNPLVWGSDVDGARVLGSLDVLEQYLPERDLKVITAIASLSVKRQVIEHLKSSGYAFCSIIHPAAVVAGRVSIGEGVIINARTVIEPGCVIGDHTIIHAGCVVEHDNHIGDFANLGPGVTTAGRVRIGSGAVIYTGATIIPDIVIGENAVVGAGAVVVHDVPESAKVVGVPARVI